LAYRHTITEQNWWGKPHPTILDLSENDFTKPGMVVQLGVPPVRIDIITKASGVSWEKADASKVPGCYGQTPVFFISREDFIANKRVTGRKKDAADIEALGEL